MGSPKAKKKYIDTLEISITEKIKLLTLGSQTKPVINSQNLLAIFEEMKGVLLPMVRWLDKPLSELSGFSFSKTCIMPPELQKHRAMLVFDGGLLGLALDRSGNWLVELFSQVPATGRIQKVQSPELVALIMKRMDALVDGLLGDYQASKEWAGLKLHLPFLEDVLRYAAVVRFVSKCYEAINKVIVEQEKRTRAMHKRLSLINDFADALDPLIAGRSTATLPAYAIFEDHERGTSRSTSTYLSPAALKPFWDVLKDLRTPDRYREYDESRTFVSLAAFASFFGYMLREIQLTRERYKKPCDARELFGFSDGRLPLSTEEVAELRKWAESIAS